MSLPHKISTLLYCFNSQDEVLLLHRKYPPNAGLWSPCGGKLDSTAGESPYQCACREAFEELQLSVTPQDLHLTGIVSEHGYEGTAHWLMFLFEIKQRVSALPAPHREGEFGFFRRQALEEIPLPNTDSEKIWPLFWQHRGGFFAAHCRTQASGPNIWTLEESRVKPAA